jgi:magnesium chelatase family protein
MCRCSGAERFRYARRVSGPLLDRIDIHVKLAAVPWADLERQRGGETSSAIRERVAAARRTAALRFPQRPAFRNADLSPSDFDRFLGLETPARALLATAVERMRLSVRAVHRALRVARTIADLEMRQTVAAAQLAEAIGYRSRSADPDAPDLDRVPLRPVRSPLT